MKDISKHLPQALYFFGVEANLEAIQFSYLLGVIKTLSAQLPNQKSKMSAVGV